MRDLLALNNRLVVGIAERLKRIMTDNEIKIQAYRDFASRLRTHKRKMKGFDLNDEFWDYAILAEDIENTLKEMVREVK